MKIDILCSDGSPLGVSMSSVFGEDGRIGVGGAELALMTMCEAWHNSGHDVTLYNTPQPGGISPFKQRNVSEYNPQDDRDVVIVFRSPNDSVIRSKGKKVWWSCDQHTIGDFKRFSNMVDKIVTISPHHTEYFESVYGIQNAGHIDLPVRFQDYQADFPKIQNRCIFTSIPDRGLMNLRDAWSQIVSQVPDATLVITSDWRLWDPRLTEEVTRNYRLGFASLPGVAYLGAVKRERLIQEQQAAQIHLYPCIYEELFCIAVAESQAVGTYPITSEFGSLKTTNMGTRISGNPHDPKWVSEFVKHTIDLMLDPPMLKIRMDRVQDAARERFHIDRIMEQWENILS